MRNLFQTRSPLYRLKPTLSAKKPIDEKPSFSTKNQLFPLRNPPYHWKTNFISQKPTLSAKRPTFSIGKSGFINDKPGFLNSIPSPFPLLSGLSSHPRFSPKNLLFQTKNLVSHQETNFINGKACFISEKPGFSIEKEDRRKTRFLESLCISLAIHV